MNERINQSMNPKTESGHAEKMRACRRLIPSGGKQAGWLAGWLAGLLGIAGFLL